MLVIGGSYIISSGQKWILVRTSNVDSGKTGATPELYVWAKVKPHWYILLDFSWLGYQSEHFILLDQEQIVWHVTAALIASIGGMEPYQSFL